MSSVDRQLSNNIHKVLSNALLENCNNFYYLAFSYIRDEEATMDVVKNCISAGLYNARKITVIPPVKTWFYQELIALAIKKGVKTGGSNRGIPASYKSPSFEKLLALDTQTRSVFILYYLEELNKSRVSKVLKIKEDRIPEILSFACKKLGINGKNKRKDEEIISEIYSSYCAPKPPKNYKKQIIDVIENEESIHEKYYKSERRFKYLKIVFGVILIIAILYLMRNTPFIQGVLDIPLLQSLFEK